VTESYKLLIYRTQADAIERCKYMKDIVIAGLSRQRPRVRVPSTPPYSSVTYGRDMAPEKQIPTNIPTKQEPSSGFPTTLFVVASFRLFRLMVRLCGLLQEVAVGAHIQLI
jgi:hypothetical protein